MDKKTIQKDIDIIKKEFKKGNFEHVFLFMGLCNELNDTED